MVPHNNRNWQRRWRVDPAACQAIHDSGLIVEFQLSEDRHYDGRPLNLGDVSKHIDINDFPRLMREAGDIYRKHLDARQ